MGLLDRIKKSKGTENVKLSVPEVKLKVNPKEPEVSLDKMLKEPTFAKVEVVGTGDLQSQLAALKTMLDAPQSERDIPAISDQLRIVQAEIINTNYLIDNLELEDVGAMVAAIRAKMKSDILAASTPKTKKKTAAPKKLTKQQALAMDLDGL